MNSASTSDHLDLEVQYAVEGAALPSAEDFQLWAETALKHVKQSMPASLAIRVVEAEESQALNHQYRGKNKPTNVLSFPFELPQGLPEDLVPEESILGDLAICAEVVAQEAEEQDKLLYNHWAHMVVHGCLHLLGYDHIKDDEAEVMEAIEIAILAKLNINDPYHIDH